MFAHMCRLAHARQLLTSIEGEAADAATASAAAAARRQEVEARQEQLKRDLKVTTASAAAAANAAAANAAAANAAAASAAAAASPTHPKTRHPPILLPPTHPQDMSPPCPPHHHLLQLELERAGDAGLLLDDAGGAYELSDDDRLPVLGMAPPGPGSGPGGMAGRSKR